MAKANDDTRIARCKCGQVTMEAKGAPIMTVACYCSDCQQAGQHLEALAAAPAIFEADGGTHFVMHRKDRLRCLKGEEQLREYRLTPTSASRRVVARCCNAAMFLELHDGHWLSLYKNRFAPDDQPVIDMRTMTKDRRPDVSFNDDIPSPQKHTFRFMFKLLMAWVAMGFKTPEINYVRDKLDG